MCWWCKHEKLKLKFMISHMQTHAILSEVNTNCTREYIQLLYLLMLHYMSDCGDTVPLQQFDYWKLSEQNLKLTLLKNVMCFHLLRLCVSIRYSFVFMLPRMPGFLVTKCFKHNVVMYVLQMLLALKIQSLKILLTFETS